VTGRGVRRGRFFLYKDLRQFVTFPKRSTHMSIIFSPTQLETRNETKQRDGIGKYEISVIAGRGGREEKRKEKSSNYRSGER